MTYVMSDIHGNQARFEDILRQINFQPEDTLYILGDVIDRFPDGIRMLRRFKDTPNIKVIRGNHEQMMLEALYLPVKRNDWDSEEYVRENKRNLWYYNGGDITHDYLKHIRKSIRQEVFEYVASLPLNIAIEVNGQKYLLTHAGVEANYEQFSYRYDDVTTYAVWSRSSRFEEMPEDTILIFGHTPTNHFQKHQMPLKLWRDDNHIGIDCGCGYGYLGRLLCLRLDDMQEFYSDI